MNSPDQSSEAFDATIRKAMQSRAVPQATPGLAARAMALAAQRPSVMADAGMDWNRVATLRRRGAVLNAVAALVLIGLMSVCYLQMKGSNSSSEAATISATESIADSATESSSSQLVWGLAADQWLFATAAMAIGILTLLCVEKAMLDDRSGWLAFRSAGPARGSL